VISLVDDYHCFEGTYYLHIQGGSSNELMIMVGTVSGMLETDSILTRLIAREGFIAFSRRDIFRS
jgi:hypothetical protein